MNETNRTVQMHVIAPGEAGPDGEFTFELQSRANNSRIVKFSLTAQDAELVKKAVEAYLGNLK